MSFRHSLRIRSLASALLVLRWFALRLPDRAWVLALRGLASLPLPAELPGVLDEAREILEEGQPGTGLLRTMVGGTTREELEDLLWGALVFDEGVLP